MDLTVQDIHNFVNAINAGRLAVGLEALSLIEYDSCSPGDPYNCLSAHHLFSIEPIGGQVTVGHVYGPVYGQMFKLERLMEPLHTEVEADRLVIPPDIKTVTDEFDQCYKRDPDWQALRQLFVEAGYIED